MSRHIETGTGFGEPPKERRFQGQNTYELLPDGDSFFADLHNEIGKAKRSVAMQFYTFEAYSKGIPLAVDLAEAHHNRGVRGRLMVDNFIDLSHNDRFIHSPRLDAESRAQTRAAHEETNGLLALMGDNGIEVKKINPLGAVYQRVLLRDHKKLVIIDGEDPENAIAYVGGLQPSDHNGSWSDFMVKMTGDIVPLLLEDYERTWEGNNYASVNNYSDGVVATDTQGSSLIIPLSIAKIREARRRVVLESPYLWGKNLEGALVYAANQPRVDVSIIVPANNNKHMFAPSERKLEKLGDEGIQVYRFTDNDGMTHARGLLTDNEATFGSNTFNEFLAGKMAEIAVMTRNPSMVTQLEKRLYTDMSHSRRQY